MKISVLDKILSTDRVRQQTSVTTKDGFARPIMCEVGVDQDAAPFLSTNLRGTFLSVPRSSEGTVRFAFTDCPVKSEDSIINGMYKAVWSMSSQYGWANRCTTLGEAKTRMESFGMRPKAFVLGPSFLREAVGDISEDDIDKLMLVQGYVAEVEGIKVMASGLLPGQAILSSEPSQVGNYTRVGNYVGVVVYRADRVLTLVGD